MSTLSELNAALLQAVITMGIAVLSAFLFVQFRKRYFLLWSVAWGVYVLRIGAICTSIGCCNRRLHYWRSRLCERGRGKH